MSIPYLKYNFSYIAQDQVSVTTLVDFISRCRMNIMKQDFNFLAYRDAILEYSFNIKTV